MRITGHQAARGIKSPTDGNGIKTAEIESETLIYLLAEEEPRIVASEISILEYPSIVEHGKIQTE